MGETEEALCFFEAGPAPGPDCRKRGASLVRAFQAQLRAAQSAGSKLKPGTDLVSLFARLQKVRHALPLKELQFEMLWLMTLDVLERRPEVPRREVWALGLKLVRSLNDATRPTQLASEARELLVHACLRLASIVSGLHGETIPELASIVELLRRHIPTLLREQSQGVPKRNALLGALQPSSVWVAFLRCVAALPTDSSSEVIHRCWSSLLDVLPEIFLDQPVPHAEGAASLAAAVRRQKALPAEMQQELLQSIWRSRPSKLAEAEEVEALGWISVAEERTRAEIDAGSSSKISGSKVVIAEALSLLKEASPSKLGVLLLRVELHLVDLLRADSKDTQGLDDEAAKNLV
jgi:hypothetical protein